MAGRPKGLVKTGGRQKGTQNRNTPEKKEQVASFFHALIDDETEAKFWRYFMTGYVVETLEDGSQKIIPIPLDSTKWASFKRAVEYKRGMPVQPIAARIDGGEAFRIVVEHIGPRTENQASAQAK